MPFHRGTAFRYRMAVGMARYSSSSCMKGLKMDIAWQRPVHFIRRKISCPTACFGASHRTVPFTKMRLPSCMWNFVDWWAWLLAHPLVFFPSIYNSIWVSHARMCCAQIERWPSVGYKPHFSDNCVKTRWCQTSSPANTDWAPPWHDTASDYAGLKTCSITEKTAFFLGKALTIGLWNLLRMIGGCSWSGILLFSRYARDDGVRFSFSFFWAKERVEPTNFENLKGQLFAWYPILCPTPLQAHVS